MSLETVGAAVVLGKGAANFEQRAQPADLCSAGAWGAMELMALYRLHTKARETLGVENISQAYRAKYK